MWGNFWAAVGGASLVFAFGIYTPVYPFVREHLPVPGSFHFPVNYLRRFLHGSGRWRRSRLGCAAIKDDIRCLFPIVLASAT